MSEAPRERSPGDGENRWQEPAERLEQPASWKVRAVRGSVGLLSRIAPGVAMDLAQRVFRTPRRVARPERERAWIGDARTQEIRILGCRIRVWEWGDPHAPTVLLVHGWEGRGSQLGAFASPLVASGHHVVAFDAPGHGDSAGRFSSLPDFADVVLQLGTRFGPLHAIVGHSMGAAGTSLAMIHGLSATRLVFVAPPAEMGDYIERMAASLGLTERVRDGMTASFERRYGLTWDFVQRVTLEAARPGVPLLVVHDRGDDATLHSSGERVAATWPEGRLHSTEGLGHRRVLRDPAVVEIVSGFVAGVSVPA